MTSWTMEMFVHIQAQQPSPKIHPKLHPKNRFLVAAANGHSRGLGGVMCCFRCSLAECSSPNRVDQATQSYIDLDRRIEHDLVSIQHRVLLKDYVCKSGTDVRARKLIGWTTAVI